MTASVCHAHRPDPQLYLLLGKLVASTGKDSFAGQMLSLVDAQVPVHRLDLSEWTLDTHQASVNRVKVLGGAGLLQDLPPHDPPSHPLLETIKQMKAPLLIQRKASSASGSAQHSAHQCNLVSGSGDRRWVICFHRLPSQPAFSLAELSLLKSLSDTLLPLLEQHAADACELTPASLRQGFGKRLAQEEVQLSTREQEVCLGLLTGGTVAQLAERLNVKNSSVETYLKRATAKLGVSGRHGLARWMAEA